MVCSTPVKSTFSFIALSSSSSPFCGAVVRPPPHEFVVDLGGGELAEVAELFESVPLFRAALPDHRQPELSRLRTGPHAIQLDLQHPGETAGCDPVAVLAGR